MPTAKIKRVFHPYTKWEEFHAGMWRIVTGKERDVFIMAAADLMSAPSRFLEAMRQAAREWKFSCEANLTSRATNKRAWIGHAGCCIATGSPEDCTRLAWWTLTQAQQDAGNAAADTAIAEWEERYTHA